MSDARSRFHYRYPCHFCVAGVVKVSVIYRDDEPVEIEAGYLYTVLASIFPVGNLITLDTETSGLFVDGDYDKAPPARVSAVSVGWYSKGRIHTLAMPFDQGRIGGKPGKWSDTLDDYETLDHVPSCGYGMSATYGKLCECAPWNLVPDDWATLCEWLTGTVGYTDHGSKSIVMHNAKYDLHIMNAGMRTGEAGVDLSAHVISDTMLMQGIVEPLQISSLKPTSERLWGEGSRDEEAVVLAALKKNGVGLTKRYDLLAWDVLGPYAGKDAELTYRLHDYQQRRVEEGSIPTTDLDIIDNELKLAKLLFKMELRRVGLDAPGMAEEAEKMRKEIARLEAELPFQPPNVNAAKRYFFGELGIVPVKVTPKGAPSLDAEVVARLEQDGVPGAAAWLHIANLNSALSKWYVSWPYKAAETEHGWRIMTNFRQGRVESDRKGMTSGGAISGRLSAERVQLQGVPKEYQLPKLIRGIKPKSDGTQGLLQAKPGYQLWEIDASNAEVRVAAWLSQCEALAKVINSGVNIHDGNTVALFGAAMADSFPGDWVDGVSNYKDHPQWNEYRDLAKIGVFSDLYGSGIVTMTAQFSQGLKRTVPQSVARNFKAAIRNAYPELSQTARRCQAKADKSMGGPGYVKLVNGRRRVFGWAERTHKAMNACIQGGVAETMKALMLLIEAAYPGVLINQVHDSVWVEVPYFNADLIVADIQAMGAKLFTETFSTEALPVMFTFDAKQLA